MVSTTNPELVFHNGMPMTITVRSLRAQNSGAEVSLGIVMACGEHREQKTLVLTMEQYCELKPCRGEISEELYERLEAASRLCEALRCGENLLSYGANSALTLTRKIMRHGYTQAEASDAVSYLQSLGLIDEWSDLSREVEKCLRKHWGADRIRAHLWSRGYGHEAMDRLPELLDEVDFPDHCAALTRKQYGGLPSDRDERNRVTAALYRYGYRLDEIKEAFKRLQQE